jgi:hypothetical protein
MIYLIILFSFDLISRYIIGNNQNKNAAPVYGQSSI